MFRSIRYSARGHSRPWIRIAALGVLLALSACAPPGETYVAARWIERDSSVVILKKWWVNKGGVIGSDDGGLRLYYVRLTGHGYRVSPRSVEVRGDPDFCDHMEYRPEDSVVAFTFAATGECLLEPRLKAAKFTGDAFRQTGVPDTVALLTRLREQGLAFDSGVSLMPGMDYDQLCFDGRGCIAP